MTFASAVRGLLAMVCLLLLAGSLVGFPVPSGAVAFALGASLVAVLEQALRQLEELEEGEGD